MAVEEKLHNVVKGLLLCYGEADSLMLCSSAEPQALKPIMKSINELSVELDFTAVEALAVIDETRREALLSQITELRYQKAKFEDKVVKWLSEHSLSKSDIDDVVQRGPTLRSTGKSRHTSCSGCKSVKSGSSGHGNTSSVLRAKAIAKQELARLRIAQLKEEQRLSRELKDLETKRQKELKDLEEKRQKELKDLEEKRVKGETRTRTSDGRKTGLRGRIRAWWIYTTRQTYHCRATMLIAAEVHNTEFQIL